MHSRSKKKKTIYFNTNYRTEMKLVPIIMDYSLLQFDAFKFVLKVRLQGRGLYLALVFSMQSPKFDNEIVKFTAHIA